MIYFGQEANLSWKSRVYEKKKKDLKVESNNPTTYKGCDIVQNCQVSTAKTAYSEGTYS
jgi:hypothetical protein